MNKNEFMESLKEKLSKLSLEDREDAINYYWEYFEEAGFGEEGDVTKNVGQPEDVAAKIIEAAEYVKGNCQVVPSETLKTETGKESQESVFTEGNKFLPLPGQSEEAECSEATNGENYGASYRDITPETFDSIDINLSSFDAIVRTGDDFGIYVSYRENKPIIERVNNKLVIRERKIGKLFDFSFNFNIFNKKKEFVEVTIPRNKKLNEIKSKTDMGKLSICAVSAEDLYIDADLGALELIGVSAYNARVSADMGHVSVQNSDIRRINIKNDTGAVNINGISTEFANISTDTGYISVENIKSVETKLGSDTGYIKLKNGTMEKLFAETDAGLIKLISVDADYIEAGSDAGSVNAKLIGNREDYSLDLSNDLGKITVDGRNIGTSIFNTNYAEGRGNKKVKINVDTGKISVDFFR